MKNNNLKKIYYDNRKVLKVCYNNKELWSNSSETINEFSNV